MKFSIVDIRKGVDFMKKVENTFFSHFSFFSHPYLMHRTQATQTSA